MSSQGTTPDSSIATLSPPAFQSDTSKTKGNKATIAADVRLLTLNRELLQYKTELRKMETEKEQKAKDDRSSENNQLLNKYAAKLAKVQHAAKKNNMKHKEKTTAHDCLSETSESDDEVVGIALATGNNEIWEVAPDPSKVFTEIDEDNFDEEAQEVVGILNHRKKYGGSPEMLMQFDNGERIWATVEYAFKDGSLFVAAYITANNLLDSSFEPKQMKKGKTDKTAMAAQMKQTKCSLKGTTDVTATATQVEQIKCSHDDYRTEIGGYKAEGDCRYFHLKYGLGDCLCALCKTKFVPAGTTTKELFRPSISKPVYMCVNRTEGCKHGVCYDCFMKNGVSRSPGLTTRCRSTRGTIKNN